jgi:hypothetical protein
LRRFPPLVTDCSIGTQKFIEEFVLLANRSVIPNNGGICVTLRKEVDLSILEKGNCIELSFIVPYLCTSTQRRGHAVE